MAIRLHDLGSYAIVEINNRPANVVDSEVVADLRTVVDHAVGKSRWDRIILTGKSGNFATGEVAREVRPVEESENLSDLLNRIESSNVPWIAAIDGLALSSGCELVLSCRYRIASSRAQFGYPEVGLGIIPNSGGTQRLPGLIGLDASLDLIVRCRRISAHIALRIGLVDELADDPVVTAKNLDQPLLKESKKLSSLKRPIFNQSTRIDALAFANKKLANQIAPLRAIDLVTNSESLSFAQGVAKEKAEFIELRQSDQARALHHISTAESEAISSTIANAKTSDISHCVVVGGGTMGSGITYSLLKAGVHVTIVELSAEAAQRAETSVNNIIDTANKRGLINGDDARHFRSLLTLETEYEAIKEAQLAIEAVYENLAIKKSVFKNLERVLPLDCVLASNTSYLNINKISAALNDSSRLVGIHFFAPAYIMKLLEIVEGKHTSKAALSAAHSLAKMLGKIPVLAQVCDGFIGNRILSRYREAADTLLIEGAMPWQVDEAMVEFGYAMGPYETQDITGLDIAFANRRLQDKNRDPKRFYPTISDRMVKEGRLGKKVGMGWYGYSRQGIKEPEDCVEHMVLEESRFANIERRAITNEEIRFRLILAQINEAASILHERIACSAKDIDLVTILGYGFPRWRGGLMYCADQIGVPKIYSDLQKLSHEQSAVWTPSQAIVDCLRLGIPLADYRKSQ